MRQAFSIILLCVTISSGALFAQPFHITTTPDSQTATNAPVSFAVHVEADANFKATVYLSANVLTLPQAQLSVTPKIINSPYTDTAWVTLVFTGPKIAGTHTIF